MVSVWVKDGDYVGIQTERLSPLFSFLIGFRRFYSRYKRECREAKRSGYAIIDKKFFVKNKSTKGEIFFVLGCGSSINAISPKTWQMIKSNTSIGLNQWICHEHVPNYLMLEGMRREASSNANLDIYYSNLKLWRDINVSNYLDKNPETIVLGKDILNTILPQRFGHYLDGERGFVIPKFTIPGRNNLSKDFSIRVLSRLVLLDQLPFFSRSSITLAISFGYSLGFKKIVLCGVDLKDANYFWDSQYYLANEFVSRPPSTSSILSVHGTVDKKIDAVTVDENIYSINESFLRPRGVELTVISDTSRLFPRIGKFSQ